MVVVETSNCSPPPPHINDYPSNNGENLSVTLVKNYRVIITYMCKGLELKISNPL